MDSIWVKMTLYDLRTCMDESDNGLPYFFVSPDLVLLF